MIFFTPNETFLTYIKPNLFRDIMKTHEELIECPFGKTIDDEMAIKLHIAVGFRDGNRLMRNKKGQCIGYVCHPEDIDQIKEIASML